MQFSALHPVVIPDILGLPGMGSGRARAGSRQTQSAATEPRGLLEGRSPDKSVSPPWRGDECLPVPAHPSDRARSACPRSISG